MNIKVYVEGPYHSNPTTIIINVGQAHFRETKNNLKRGNEGVGGTTQVHVEVKKARK
jgi:hypothetical protein